MREILFKGKRTDNGEWVEGCYTFSKKENRHLIWVQSDDPKEWWHTAPIEVKADTVSQFTGLTDKNGKEIFEGDILECYQKGESIRGHVALKDGCFFAMFANGQKAWIDGAIKQFKAVIIGNIHDNPELLKEDKPCG